MKKQIPNCMICKWLSYALTIFSMQCGAQGLKLLSECYNNKMCKKLYEEKENQELIK